MIITETKFIIESSRERIWQVLLKAMMSCLPFERMQLVDEKKFCAVLPIKIGFVALPMNVKIEIVDMSPPEVLETILKAKSLAGVIWLNQRATFTLQATDEGKTEVACRIVVEEMATLLRVVCLWKVKRFVADTFKEIEGRLKQWA